MKVKQNADNSDFAGYPPKLANATQPVTCSTPSNTTLRPSPRPSIPHTWSYRIPPLKHLDAETADRTDKPVVVY